MKHVFLAPQVHGTKMEVFLGDMERRLTPEKISVLIICSHQMVREGLGLLLAQDEDITVIGGATDSTQVQGFLERQQPTAVVIAHTLLYQNFASQVSAIKATWPEIPILVISAEVQPGFVQSILAAGATGYLTPDTNADELIHAVYMVARGELTLHPNLVQGLLSNLAGRSSGSHPDLSELTPKEHEILGHLARGLSDRNIAQTLYVSVRTVQTHLAHIYEKLGVHSRTEVAVLALKAGWVLPAKVEEDSTENT